MTVESVEVCRFGLAWFQRSELASWFLVKTSRCLVAAFLASLGTLGEAETLPFLVGLIGAADKEVAATAQAAVDRINRSGVKTRK